MTWYKNVRKYHFYIAVKLKEQDFLQNKHLNGTKKKDKKMFEIKKIYFYSVRLNNFEHNNSNSIYLNI